MEKLPTVEEFLELWKDSKYPVSYQMKQFAKLHVKAALEAASEKANMLGITQHMNSAPDKYEDFVYVVDSNGPDYGYTVNKESILNAYPLDNIK